MLLEQSFTNFDSSVIENETGEVVKAVVTFVVERDGTISNIKVSGANADFNKEAEKTIKGIKGKWNPAKFQGENVRSYFRFLFLCSLNNHLEYLISTLS
jgi:protein TonB